MKLFVKTTDFPALFSGCFSSFTHVLKEYSLRRTPNGESNKYLVQQVAFLLVLLLFFIYYFSSIYIYSVYKSYIFPICSVYKMYLFRYGLYTEYIGIVIELD